MATTYSPQYNPFLKKPGDQTVYQEVVIDDADSHHGSTYRPLDQSGGDREKKKTVLSRFIRPWKLLIHLVALAATGGVLQLSFRNVFWFDSGTWTNKWYFLMLGQDEIMNGLQFAAKLHEILIMGSLTAMVMHFVRRRLVGRGLPFGLLTAGYQAGSVEFLFSKSMRASARRSCADLLFVIFLALVIIFANMIGPSSAIAILPNLDWWPVSDPFNGLPLTTYLTVNKSDGGLYPLHMTASSVAEYDICSTSNYSLEVLCPNTGFDTLLSWALAYANENSGANVSMSEPISGTRRQLLSQNVTASPDGVATGDPGVAVATTLHQSLNFMTGLFWYYVKSNDAGKINMINRPLLTPSDDSPVAGPLVQVQCNYFDYFDATTHTSTAADGVTFPTRQLNSFSSIPYPTNSSWLVDPSLWNLTRPLNTTNFTWVDLTGYNKTALPHQEASLGALVTVPYLVDYITPKASDSEQSSWIIPCTIDARWAASQIEFDPTNNDLIESNLTTPVSFSLANASSSLSSKDFSNQQSLWGISNAITIDPAWADLLDVPGIVFDGEDSGEGSEIFNTTMMQTLFHQFINNNTFKGTSQKLTNGSQYRQFSPPYFDGNATSLGSSTAVTIETIIAMVIAEGLSRSIYAGAAPVTVINNDPKNITIAEIFAQAGGFGQRVLSKFPAATLAQWPSFNFTVQRYGYGYGWNESRTVQFGLVVLMIYAVAALLYIAYSMWFLSLRGPMHGKKGWMSGAWAEASEMLALALVTPERRSRQVLGNVGAGVDEGATWRKTVRVDERTEGKLELVVDNYVKGNPDNERVSGVVVGKKYS